MTLHIRWEDGEEQWVYGRGKIVGCFLMILYLSGAFPSIMDRAASAGGVCLQGGDTTGAFFWDNGVFVLSFFLTMQTRLCLRRSLLIKQRRQRFAACCSIDERGLCGVHKH